MVLAGEAGIGKSRLVAEARTYAAQLGLAILQGTCFEPDRALPFAPLIDLLRTWCASRSVDEIAQVFGPIAPQLARLLPELQALLPGSAPAPPLEPDQEQRRLFRALAQFLICGGAACGDVQRLPSQGAPALIVLEDLHWCDDTTLDFLSSFVRGIETYPLLLLLTYRSDEVDETLRHFLATLDRTRQRVAEIELNRLGRGDVQEMIAAIFEQRQPVRREFVEAVHTLTDGNPFFIEETLKALVTSGDIFFERGIWTRKPMSQIQIPRTVHDALRLRVQQLSPDARAVLRLAAVLGRRFDFDVLRELAHRDEAEMLELVKALIAAQLVVEESADQFAFRHALTREAIYSSMLARERRPLHLASGQALERRFAHQLDAHAAELAYHFSEAGEWARAMEYARCAGERAQALFSLHAAVEHYTRAIHAAEQLGRPVPAPLHYARARAYELLGDFDAARHEYEHARRLARDALEGRAEWQSLLALGFLWVGRDYALAGHYFRQALDVARALDDPATLAQTLNRLGNWHMMTDEPGRSVECHLEALGIVQAVDDRRGIAATLDLLGIACFMRGDMRSGARYYEQAVRLWRELGERQWLINSLAIFAARGGNYLFATARCQPVSLAQCVAEAEEALDLARQIGWPNGEITALLWMGNALGPRGEWERACAAAQAALAAARAIDHPLGIATAHHVLGAALLDMGAFARAQSHFERGLALGHAMGSTYVILGMSGRLASTLIGQRRLDEVESVLNAVSDMNLPVHIQAQHHIWYARSELALARHDPTTALQILDRLVASPGTPESLGTHGVVPRLWLVRGEALAELGQRGAAESTLYAARDAAQMLGAHAVLWRIHAALARLYRTQRRHDAAEHAAAEARAGIDALAARAPDTDLAETFVRHALAMLPPSRTLTPRQADKKAFGGLTEREREIAVLVAQGKTSRAIAAELTLSERTIEKHIANIMAKLGVDTRTQIGVWTAEQGLVRP